MLVLGHDAVDHHDDRRRDEDAQRSAGRDRAGGEGIVDSLKRRISGIATRAMVAAVAIEEPQMAPKPAHAAMVDIASPPRQ